MPAASSSLLLLLFVPLLGAWGQEQPAGEREGGPPPGDSTAVIGALKLSSPATGSTAIPLEGTILSWTEAHGVKTHTLELSTESTFQSGVVLQETLPGRTTSFELPSEVLEPGRAYYWRVLAECDLVLPLEPGPPPCPAGATVPASNAPYRFTTMRAPFRLPANLRLQRAVAGPDAGEGATFSFLTIVDEKTIFLADFALIWAGPKLVDRGSAHLGMQASVEGKLTSDEARAEDAWRFRASAVLDKSFLDVRDLRRRRLLDGLYLSVGAKYEADQGWHTRKILSEVLLTPSSRLLAIGFDQPPESSRPLQFVWRPLLAVEAGHTIRRRGGVEKESTLLRLVPRLRARTTLNFMRRALALNDFYLFVDDTFHYLPLEEAAETHNLLVSGVEIEVSDNFGVSFTYKNGESAPEFERIETFGGGLSVRF